MNHPPQHPLAAARSDTRWVLLVFLLSLIAFEWIWGRRFYASLDHVGHDFALTGIGLLEGRNWVALNGWLRGWFDPPWFTPAWCAGTAFYADPQSAFYSPLQLLALWFDPFQATHLNTLLFAVVAFWGGYLLARRAFGWTAAGSAIFAVIGMANAFLPLRSAVGEAGYQPLYLWTWLALALCWPATRRGGIPWPSIGVALVLSGWLQFGFAGMMVPVSLGVAALCLVHALRGRIELSTLAGRALLGSVLAIALNASKLYESISLMRNFPRSFYAIPGFPQLGDAVAAIGFALFQPSEWTAAFAATRMVDVQFSALPHEWALNFGWGALLLAVVATAALMLARKSDESAAASAPTVTPMQALALFGLAALLAIPLLLLWNNGGLRTLIKQVPILNSTAWPMRWIVIYLPLVQMLLAWPLQNWACRLSAPAGRVLAAVALLAVWVAPALEPLGYYLSRDYQYYDPKPVLRAFALSRMQGPIPIDRITGPVSGGLSGARNDTMLQGASQGLCYNPIYGYRLESFPQLARLSEGPALAPDRSGRSMLLNPACLVHPADNQCRPGDGFDLRDPHQREQAERFLARRPFDWARPPLGIALSYVSTIGWGAMAMLCIVAALLAAGRRIRRGAARSAQ